MSPSNGFMILLAQLPQEIDPAHHRHVPIQQDRVRHRPPAGLQGFQPVAGLLDLEAQVFQNPARHFSDHAAVVNDQAAFHGLGPLQAACAGAPVGASRMRLRSNSIMRPFSRR
jgi:hypothetical protein